MPIRQRSQKRRPRYGDQRDAYNQDPPDRYLLQAPQAETPPGQHQRRHHDRSDEVPEPPGQPHLHPCPCSRHSPRHIRGRAQCRCCQTTNGGSRDEVPDVDHPIEGQVARAHPPEQVDGHQGFEGVRDTGLEGNGRCHARDQVTGRGSQQHPGPEVAAPDQQGRDRDARRWPERRDDGVDTRKPEAKPGSHQVCRGKHDHPEQEPPDRNVENATRLNRRRKTRDSGSRRLHQATNPLSFAPITAILRSFSWPSTFHRSRGRGLDAYANSC